MPLTRPTSILCLAFLLHITRPGASFAATSPDPPRSALRHASVTLVADSTALSPSRDVLLGLRFTIEDGWHVYWRNPGESGSPPEVRWRPTKGLRFGEIEWPVPDRLSVQGVTNYGYEHQVLLLVPVKRTADGPIGGQVAIDASVNYVICREVCVKEAAAPSMTLEVEPGLAKPSAAAADFRRAMARLPRPMPAGWKTFASLGNGEIALTVDTRRAEPTAAFFPFEQGVIDDSAAQEVEPHAGGLTLRIKRSPFSVQAPSTLEGLLVLPTARAYTLRARLSQ